MAKAAVDFPGVEVTSRAEWRAWLQKNHAKSQSIWLVTFKKGDPRYLPNNDVVEEALCFGWIDSLPRKLDAKRTMLMLAPRRSASAWSKLNKDRALCMIAAKKMTPAGLAKIKQAKVDGTWTKLDSVDALKVPADLVAAFKTFPGSAKNFAAFPPSARRGILEWIVQAKRPETRAKRIIETARLAQVNQRANQWRK